MISDGAQVHISQHLVLGSVTVIDFYADWCGPYRQLSPSLEQMARNDTEIALRKIDIVNWKTAVAQQFNIHTIPQVNVYDRSGRLVGTVLGVDFEKVKSYCAGEVEQLTSCEGTRTRARSYESIASRILNRGL